MPKRLTAMRLSVYTEQQLDSLTSSFGMTKTEVIQMAIDRLYQAEIAGQIELPRQVGSQGRGKEEEK